MTFQSMDEMSDKMTGDEDFGKSIGKDLEEGKIMPTIKVICRIKPGSHDA